MLCLKAVGNAERDGNKETKLWPMCAPAIDAFQLQEHLNVFSGFFLPFFKQWSRAFRRDEPADLVLGCLSTPPLVLCD